MTKPKRAPVAAGSYEIAAYYCDEHAVRKLRGRPALVLPYSGEDIQCVTCGGRAEIAALRPL